jgi:hypothetical protein
MRKVQTKRQNRKREKAEGKFSVSRVQFSASKICDIMAESDYGQSFVMGLHFDTPQLKPAKRQTGMPVLRWRDLHKSLRL